MRARRALQGAKKSQCIGFSPDFAWLDAPVFNGRGHPQHVRGVIRQEGLYS
jgi:putative flavoprotein involved in K+ transport